MARHSAAALTLTALLWTAALVAAPLALARDAFTAPAAAVYAFSARICHQRRERSFHLADRPLPVCARCFALYVAGALGAVAAWGSRRTASDRARLALLLSGVPTAATWLTEFAGLAAFSNTTRALAALPLGTVAGWLLVQMLRYDFSLNGQIDHRGSRVRSC